MTASFLDVIFAFYFILIFFFTIWDGLHVDSCGPRSELMKLRRWLVGFFFDTQ